VLSKGPRRQIQCGEGWKASDRFSIVREGEVRLGRSGVVVDRVGSMRGVREAAVSLVDCEAVSDFVKSQDQVLSQARYVFQVAGGRFK
jgi:hypothetical protein